MSQPFQKCPSCGQVRGSWRYRALTGTQGIWVCYACAEHEGVEPLHPTVQAIVDAVAPLSPVERLAAVRRALDWMVASFMAGPSESTQIVAQLGCVAWAARVRAEGGQ